MKSKMLDAFLNQTNIDDKKADLNEEARNKVSEINMEKAMTHLAGSKPSMSEAINAPTKIEAQSLDGTPEIHENFKNYDHSLETTRDWLNPSNNT